MGFLVEGGSKVFTASSVLSFLLFVILFSLFGYGWIHFTGKIDHLTNENTDLKIAVDTLQKEIRVHARNSDVMKPLRVSKRCMMLANTLNFNQPLSKNTTTAFEQRFDAIEAVINSTIIQSKKTRNKADGNGQAIISLSTKNALCCKRIDEINAHIQPLQKETAALEKRINEVSSAVSSTNKTKTKCKDPNYRYNPFSGKCVRLEKKLYKWAEADSHCKSKGETLVTVDSSESAFWIRHQFIAVGWIGSRWDIDKAWTAGKKVNRKWKWYGSSDNNSLITIGFWGLTEPSGNGECVAITRSTNYYWDDDNCEAEMMSLCEKKET